MNETLAATPVPDSAGDARRIWAEYSNRWQLWNTVRTVFSGLSLLLAAIGLAALEVMIPNHTTECAPVETFG